MRVITDKTRRHAFSSRQVAVIDSLIGFGLSHPRGYINSDLFLAVIERAGVRVRF